MVGIKEKILKTAYGMILERGYEKTTLRAIAEECGITHANILYHYKGKADIANQVTSRYLSALTKEVETIASRNALRPSFSKASLFWMTHLCYMVEYPDFARAYSEMLREDTRPLMNTFIHEHEKRNPVGELFRNQLQDESEKTLAWKVEILTYADYSSIKKIANGEFSLREGMFYMLDILSLLFAEKKRAKTALERDISLLLDLVTKEDLQRINSCCKF